MTVLPRLLVLTDRTASPRPLPEQVAAAVDGGARAVVLRERDLPPEERAVLVDRLRTLLGPVGGLLVLAGPGSADAVHLAGRDRLPAPRPRLVGRSCHDAPEVRRAADEGCDWVTLSPVYATASKPGYGPPLGLAGLAALTALPEAPRAYALGGVDVATAGGCRAAGAHGVAVLGAVMRAERPDRVVASLLRALEAA